MIDNPAAALGRDWIQIQLISRVTPAAPQDFLPSKAKQPSVEPPRIANAGRPTCAGAQAGFSGYAQVSCAGKRATPDVALDADPASGVSVYDSTRTQGQKGWFAVGGTSASSPMWAARSAVSGTTVNADYVYGNSITYRDIQSGNNGAPCLVGFDLCTGRGSWTG